MRIIPVLDLLNGAVVRGIAGHRDEYAPIVSRLTDSAEPLRVAEAIRERFRLTEFYVADLGAIIHQRPHHAVIQELIAAGFTLLVDAGVRTIDDAAWVAKTGSDIIIGLEAVAGPRVVKDVVTRHSPDRVIFSLDLQGGQAMLPPQEGSTPAWPSPDPLEIAAEAYRRGCRRFIVLDLQQVGTAAGPSTLPLCRHLREQYPGVEIITGGGCRHADDINQLRSTGVDAVLIASALHDERITPADIAACTG